MAEIDTTKVLAKAGFHSAYADELATVLTAWDDAGDLTLDIHEVVVVWPFREVWIVESACDARENGDYDIYRDLLRGGTSEVHQVTGWLADLRVSTNGDGV
jgi:hypothetical protein